MNTPGNSGTIELIEELEGLEKKTTETPSVAFEHEYVSPDVLAAHTEGALIERRSADASVLISQAVLQAVLKELDESRKWIDAMVLMTLDVVQQRPERLVTIAREQGKYSATIRRAT